jgi:hypothetical protein
MVDGLLLGGLRKPETGSSDRPAWSLGDAARTDASAIEDETRVSAGSSSPLAANSRFHGNVDRGGGGALSTPKS